MSDRDGGGQPLKILNVDGRSLELEEHSLARLLLDERVKDKPVVVIAVVGAFRKGKSFLLCFLLRYLRNMGQADWLGDPDASLEGFEWRGGSERQTTGILMWNEVFLVKDSQGDELAVLLMDTQGTFDSQSPSVVHSSIFALSAMISSVLVYNVGCARPFQSLLFLVRDWPSAWEMQYGELGGRELLEKRLQVAEGQDEELRQLRMKIFKCFKKINCFLMPHPGLTVTHAASCRAALDSCIDFYTTSMIVKMDATFDVYCEYLTEKDKRSFNPEFFDHVARNVAHGFVTTGLGAAAIALAVVELPLVAIALALAGGCVPVRAHNPSGRRNEARQTQEKGQQAQLSDGCGRRQRQRNVRH
ncbi:hypothetical protein MTO96_038349 [Rhipicephalus appendiculatus]